MSVPNNLMLPEGSEATTGVEGPWEKFCSDVMELLISGEYQQLRLKDIQDLGVANWIVDLLKSMRSTGCSEEEILSAFLLKLVTLRLKDRVEEYVIYELKKTRPVDMPAGFTDVLTSVIKAIEKDMKDPKYCMHG